MQYSEQEVIDKAFAVATSAAITASNHILQYWAHPLNKKFNSELKNDVTTKEGMGNIVTLADKQSEEIIMSALTSEDMLKDHTYVGEESSAVLTDSEYQWFIDPIDGTLPFKHGLPEFGICIGLVYKQKPVVGVIARPALGQYIGSQFGKGVGVFDFSKNKIFDLSTHDAGEIKVERLMIGFDASNPERVGQLHEITNIVDNIGYMVSYGSSCAATYRVAMKQLDGYIHHKPYRWDIAAPSAILLEMGGKVSSIDGSPVDWTHDQPSFLASYSPQIHSQLISFLNK